MSNSITDQHLIIISLDALNAQDFDYIKQLPNFKCFLEEGSYVRQVESVYPSVTYTCHTSIITGTYPDKHGISHNKLLNPKELINEEWYWHRKYIHVPTLFDYANQAGLKTANVLWPVMAGAQIQYNCPEIWPIKGESYFSLYLKYATKNIFPIVLKNSRRFKGTSQPYLDNFVEGLATDIILKKKPHLLCMHLIELDYIRHRNGLHGPKIHAVLDRLDVRIGNILEAAKAAEIYDKTTFVLLGDHGCADFDKVIYLNTFFAQKGYLFLDENNNITDWKVFANCCGGSAQIKIHEDASSSEREEIEGALNKLAVMPGTFIKKLLTKEEASHKYHLSGDFDYILEPKDGYACYNDIKAQHIMKQNEIENCFFTEHGQFPTHRDLKTLLFAKGPRIKKGGFIEKANIVDEGPTFAKILGLTMKNVDGRVLNELLQVKERE